MQTPLSATVSGPLRLSKRLLDPNQFSGSRDEFPRFKEQIREKIQVNLDRFLTAYSRLAYV